MCLATGRRSILSTSIVALILLPVPSSGIVVLLLMVSTPTPTPTSASVVPTVEGPIVSGAAALGGGRWIVLPGCGRCRKMKSQQVIGVGSVPILRIPAHDYLRSMQNPNDLLCLHLVCWNANLLLVGVKITDVQT